MFYKIYDKEGAPFIARRIKKSDTKELVRLFASFSSETRKRFHPHPFTKEFAKKICSNKKDIWFVLLNVDTQRFAGYAFVNKIPILKSSGYLGIAVSDDFQRKGLGLKLMKTLLAVCRKEHVKEIYLNVDQDNLSALKIYKKLGFKKIKISLPLRYLITTNELVLGYGFWVFKEFFKKKRTSIGEKNPVWMRKTLI